MWRLRGLCKPRVSSVAAGLLILDYFFFCSLVSVVATSAATVEAVSAADATSADHPGELSLLLLLLPYAPTHFFAIAKGFKVVMVIYVLCAKGRCTNCWVRDRVRDTSYNLSNGQPIASYSVLAAVRCRWRGLLQDALLMLHFHSAT